MNKHPRIGIGVIIEKNGDWLLGKRKGSHGEGTWCFPGGHLELYESFEDCAIRELNEETGLSAESMEFYAATNDIMKDEEKHYVTIFMKANEVSGTPTVCEPEKCEEWRWFAKNELPENLFLPIRNLLKQM